MNKIIKSFLIITTISLVGVGCAKTPALQNNNNNAALNTPAGSSYYLPADKELTIKILADNSFEPTSAFIKANTTITWLNTDTKLHQILSDKNDLAVFGPKEPLKPGEKYSYTFTKIGRIIYHDPLNPAFGGSVEVIE